MIFPAGIPSKKNFLFFVLCVCFTITLAAQTPQTAPTTLDEILAKADTLKKDGKLEEQLTLLNEGLQLAISGKSPQHEAKFRLKIARCYYVKKDYQKTEEQLLLALQAQPDFAEGHALLGRVYFLQERWDDAERELIAGLSVERLKPFALNQLFQIAIQKGKEEEALDYSRQHEKLEPESPAVQVQIAMVLRSMKKYEEAEAAFKRSLELKPTSDAYREFGMLRYVQKRDREALQLLREAEKLAPDDEIVHLQLGMVLREMDPKESEIHFKRSIEIKPSPQAYEEYARLVMGFEDRMQEAEGLLKKALELTQTPSPLVLATYASFLAEQDRYEEAIGPLKQAFELQPDSEKVTSMLGMCLVQTGALEEALPYLQRSIQLQQAMGMAAEKEFGFVGFIYEMLGRYQEGENVLLKVYEEGVIKNDPVTQIMGLLGLADLYFKQGLHRAGIEKATEAVSVCKKSPGADTTRMAVDALIALGSQVTVIRDFDLAESSLQEALKIAQSQEEPEFRTSSITKIYLVKGDLYFAKDEYPQAKDFYLKALETAQVPGLVKTQMQILDNLNRLYQRMGEFQKQKESWHTFLDLKFTARTDMDKDDFYDAASRISYRNGKYETALEYDRKRLELQQIKNLPLKVCDILQAIGHDYQALGNPGEALTSYEQALQRIQEHPRVPGEIAATKSAMARVYVTLGDYKRARALLLESKQLYEETHRRDQVVETLVSIADLDYGLGNYKDAFDAYQNAGALFHELEAWLGEAEQYYRMGIIREDEGKYTEALQFLQNALIIEDQRKDVLSGLYTRLSIASQYTYLGELEKAEKQILEAKQIIEEGGAAVIGLHRTVSGTLGELNLKKGNLEEAENLLKQATSSVSWKAWYLLGLVQEKRNEEEKAIESLKTCVEIIEKIRQATLGTPQEGNFRVRYRDIYNTLIELLIRQRKIDEAFYYVELQKLVEFQETIRSRRELSGSKEDEALAKARGYQFRLIDIQKQLSQELSKETQFRDQDLIDNLGKLLSGLEKEFKIYLKEHPEIEAKLQNSPKQLGSIMSSIPEDVVIIQPVILSDRISTLVYTHSARFPVEKQIDAATVNRKIREFYSALRDGSEQEAQEISAQFYDWLISPVENQIDQAKILVVSAAGSLRKIPFQALYNPKKKQYLIERLPVVNLAFLKIDYPDWSRQEIRIRALADPVGDLPGAVQQVERVSKLFFTDAFFHEQATIDKLKWQKGKELFNVLMFATHAEFDDLEPDKSYILFADNKRLTYDTISEYRPTWQDEVRLAVLSACQTAKPFDTDEWAFNSLAQEFDEIGIHSILASLWKVSDTVTSDLIVAFFENIKQGHSMAQALQQAQLKLLHSEYSRPYFWASFILIGDWR